MDFNQKNLFQGLLKHAAESNPETGITIIHQNPHSSPTTITYQNLYQQTLLRSQKLLQLCGEDLSVNPVVLLHVDNHLNAIIWFWAIVASGAIPCMSTQFSKDVEQRNHHIRGLQEVLKSPTIITTDALVPEFGDLLPGLSIYTTNSIDAAEIGAEENSVYGAVNHSAVNGENHYATAALSATNNENRYATVTHSQSDLAILMLTSGSTGNSKAVCLTTAQILSSLSGKILLHGTQIADTFLSWTGLDHVANLVEIHLHAVALSAPQVHVPSPLVLANPLSYLQYLSDYRAAYTFAPNFFLASIVRALERGESLTVGETLKLDLSNLRALISGGESNVVEMCAKLQNLLQQQYNAPKAFIRPGLGLTETCAGAVYSKECPDADIPSGNEHCSVGFPTHSIKLRIVDTSGNVLPKGEMGLLQFSGPAVFNKYYNNPVKTAESFTPDGWFQTGDLALLNAEGRLHLTGRQKETIIINGLNHYLQAIEAVLESAKIKGLTPSYNIAFPHRPKDYDTEVLCIVYLPSYSEDDYAARLSTASSISKAIILYCGVRPWKILPLSSEHLQKSSLGKLSRAKIRKAFESGKYAPFEEADTKIKTICAQQVAEPAQTPTESALVAIFTAVFPSSAAEIGRSTDLFSLGFSSVDLLMLQSRLQDDLGVQNIPLSTLFSNPVLHELAAALGRLKAVKEYNPIVVLQPSGKETPLWFIHPGLGEILIFVNLSRYITDRPVYALRARGFNGEEYFKSMDESISAYHAAIKKQQPNGPYALAGYSFGSVLAFEIAKRMQDAGDEVRFLASFDQAPYFKARARGYDWYEVVLSVAFFLSLMSEEYARAYLPEARKKSREEVLDHVMALAPEKRLRELGMDREKIDNWAKLAFELKRITWNYDPQGMVKHMDAFYTGPLVGIVLAKNVEEWFDGFISKWRDFVEPSEETDGGNTGIKFHFVQGTHRTMISPPYLQQFQKTFKEAMAARGL
ncbi:hypothetical protein G7Y89_g7822 [Cudoniella acicularis]|uniref:Carrier domain-containing protein n=1 Tax=Cudoniella acicularis TaxID=354080 RepID=A0A8H4W165_9HELO|nr:hypothetical protein G7Y89_g7822 [Cudoniella acicularis]